MSTKQSARIKQKRRSGEPWISNNRVLTGNGNSKKGGGNFGRNPNFDTDETKLLIQLWGDPKVQRTLITTHKKHAVICQLASKMQDYGYYRSPEEITTRIKNLKCFYNRLKKDMEIDHASEPTWKHFGEMDAIMTRPIFSVRPNEVPAPSLKYQLEKAREEREEKRKRTVEEGGIVSDSDDEIDDIIALSKSGRNRSDIDDDGIIPDVEVDIDINDEAFAVIADAAEKSVKRAKKRKLSKASEDSLEDASDYEGEPERENNTDTVSDGEKPLQIKEEVDSNEGKHEDPLRLPNEAESKRTKNCTDSKNEAKTTRSKKLEKDVETVSTSTAAALLTPKEEPIDVDAEDSNDTAVAQANITALMPTLADILKMSNTSIATISSAGLMVPISNITTVASSTAATITTTSNAAPRSIAPKLNASAAQTPGKISLVPTNFLMQPKSSKNTAPIPIQPQQQIHLLNTPGQLQPRLLISGPPQATQAKSPNSTGIVATGAGGMKVLLVNAEQAGVANQLCAATPTLTHVSNTNCVGQTLGTMLPLNSTTTALLQQQQQQHQQQLQQFKQQMQQQQQQQQQNLKQQQEQLKQQQERREKADHLEKLQQQQRKKQERERTKREELMTKKDVTGMRILLRQLLNAQTEANDIEHQRLTMERERFDFEKTVVERFFATLPSLFAQQQPTMLQPQQQQKLIQAMQQQSTASHLRLNPPKLVFTTTAVPTMGSSATILTPTTLTTSLPKSAKPVEICTQINDIQLLTPKIENED